MTKQEQKDVLMKDINIIISQYSSHTNNTLFTISNLLGEEILGPVNEANPIHHWGDIVKRILDNDKFDEAKWIFEEEILKCL